MKPHDPKDIAGTVLSTKELLETFTDASHPETDIQSDLLRQMSGYHDNYKAYGAAHETDPESEDNKNYKSARDSQRVALNAARWRNMDLIKLGGVGFSFNQLIRSFTHTQEKLEGDIEQTQISAVINEKKDLACTQNGRPFRTELEMEQYGLRHGFDQINGTMTLEDTIVVDGVRVNAAQYQEMQETQETLAAVNYYAVQVESGQLDPNDLPDDIKQLLVESHQELEAQAPSADGLVYSEPAQVEASFEDIISVTPTLSPELKP